MKVSNPNDLNKANPTVCMQVAPTENDKGAKVEFSQRIFHFFSGPSNRIDGFAAAMTQAGYICEEYDIVNRPEEDLAAEQVWQKVHGRLKGGCYQAMLAGPPCNAFTDARKDDGQGPRPLRARDGPQRYGLENLDEENKKKVKLGNLFAERTCLAVNILDDQERPSIVEQPKHKEADNAVSMFKLDEFIELRSKDTVKLYDIAQCQYGATATKPTTLLGCRMVDRQLKEKCDRPKLLWRKPSTGEKHWGAHPPLVGKNGSYRPRSGTAAW